MINCFKNMSESLRNYAKKRTVIILSQYRLFGKDPIINNINDKINYPINKEVKDLIHLKKNLEEVMIDITILMEAIKKNEKLNDVNVNDIVKFK